MSDSANSWTVACQAPLSMRFSRQEYWSGLPFPSPGDLPDPRMEPWSSKLQADSSPSELPGKPLKKKILFLECYIHRIFYYVFLCSWLLLYIMFLRFIHVHLFSMLDNIPLYKFVDENLCYLHLKVL